MSDSVGLEGLAVQTGLWGSVESREGRRYWVLHHTEWRGVELTEMVSGALTRPATTFSRP